MSDEDRRVAKEHSTAVSEETGALQSLADTVEFLLKHPPYAQLETAQLQLLLRNASVRYYPEGERLNSDSDLPPKYILVILQGLVQASESDGLNFLVGVGETIFNVAVFEQRPSRPIYQAARDCFVLEIPAQDFLNSVESNPPLSRYCRRRASELVDLAKKRRVERASLELQGTASLDRKLDELATSPVITCGVGTSISEAVSLMHQSRVGCIVVMEEADQPVGIFTLHDLRSVVASGHTPLTDPISKVMSKQLKSLDANLAAFEAVALMAESHIRHLPIVKDGRLWGMVSEKDLFALQRASLVQVARKLNSADTIAQLRDGLLAAQELSQQLLAHGASARQLTSIITRLNDKAVSRCIEIVARNRPWPSNVLWLAFGSEGRGEQTLATDQDNGLVLLANETGGQREEILETCAAINQALDEIGFPLCRGNTMASNPDFCLSLNEWNQRLANILEAPTPQNLLDASILFDARVVHGDTEIWSKLMYGLQYQLSTNSRFLHAFASHALEWRPPLSVLGRVRTKKVDGKHTVDLKKHALQPIIAAVRVLALASEIQAVNTEDRLRLLAESGAIREADERAWVEAFAFVQLQRMTLNQQQVDLQLPLNNILDVQTLNPLDKRIFREVLRQIGRLQKTVKLKFQIT